MNRIFICLLLVTSLIYAQELPILKIHYTTDADNLFRNTINDPDQRDYAQDYDYSVGISQDYTKDIGLSISKAKQTFSVGFSLGGLRTHNQGFGEKFDNGDDYGGEYIGTGAQLRAYWLAYSYMLYKKKRLYLYVL